MLIRIFKLFGLDLPAKMAEVQIGIEERLELAKDQVSQTAQAIAVLTALFALAAVALDYLVDKVAQRFPLQAACVLKFVEKPVIIRGVEPEIHFLAGERLKRFCSPTGSAGCREQTGDIEKGKLSGIANLSLVARFEASHQIVERARPLKPAF